MALDDAWPQSSLFSPLDGAVKTPGNWAHPGG
jgi:hypothetical protein